MLVLSRKVGERIWIGNEVCVTVVRLTSGGVRLGIEAPPELPVIREELKLRQASESVVTENPVATEYSVTRETSITRENSGRIEISLSDEMLREVLGQSPDSDSQP